MRKVKKFITVGRSAIHNIRMQRLSVAKLNEATELMEEAECVAELANAHEEENMLKETELTDREYKISRMEILLNKEMSHMNKYHPVLAYTEPMMSGAISQTELHHAMNTRLFGPMIDWDDRNDRGTVKFAYANDFGPVKFMAFGVSQAALRDMNGIVSDNMIKDYGKLIAAELVTKMISDITEAKK